MLRLSVATPNTNSSMTRPPHKAISQWRHTQIYANIHIRIECKMEIDSMLLAGWLALSPCVRHRCRYPQDDDTHIYIYLCAVGGIYKKQTQDVKTFLNWDDWMFFRMFRGLSAFYVSHKYWYYVQSCHMPAATTAVTKPYSHCTLRGETTTSTWWWRSWVEGKFKDSVDIYVFCILIWYLRRIFFCNATFSIIMVRWQQELVDPTQKMCGVCCSGCLCGCIFDCLLVFMRNIWRHISIGFIDIESRVFGDKNWDSTLI